MDQMSDDYNSNNNKNNQLHQQQQPSRDECNISDQQQQPQLQPCSPIPQSVVVDGITKMDIEEKNDSTPNNNIHSNTPVNYQPSMFNIPASSINSIGNLVNPMRSSSADGLLHPYKTSSMMMHSSFSSSVSPTSAASSISSPSSSISSTSSTSSTSSSSSAIPYSVAYTPSPTGSHHSTSTTISLPSFSTIGGVTHIPSPSSSITTPTSTSTTSTYQQQQPPPPQQQQYQTHTHHHHHHYQHPQQQQQPSSEVNIHYLPPPTNVESRLKEFKVVRVIGTGTFGRVYLVQNQIDHTFYAMKCLNKSDVVKLKQVEHLNSEKSILASIHHPFIVNLYQSFQDEKKIYLLFEYVAGGEVFTHLRRANTFSNSMAKFYAAEIVLALEYLHKHNIVYRDLKPENLLLDNQGHIKITDFGFAKRVEDRTFTLCGTPEYLAPEIIQSKGHGKAVDWWALGILIFEMLAGFPPFYDDDTFAIYDKILAARITFPKHFDLDAKDLVKKLLTSDRTRRLGALRDGAQDVKNHRWFADIDWSKLHQRKVMAPFVPNIQFQGDSSNFEKYDEEPMREEIAPNYVDPYANLFKDF